MEELTDKFWNYIDLIENWALSEQQTLLTLIEPFPPGLCHALIVCN